MKTWNKQYPKKRQRLLSVLREYHYDRIKTGQVASYEDVQRVSNVIGDFNRRLNA